MKTPAVERDAAWACGIEPHSAAPTRPEVTLLGYSRRRHVGPLSRWSQQPTGKIVALDNFIPLKSAPGLPDLDGIARAAPSRNMAERSRPGSPASQPRPRWAGTETKRECFVKTCTGRVRGNVR
jgi:hypothetical protein